MEKPQSSIPLSHGQSALLVKKYTSGPYLKTIVKMALDEDLGPGDLTASIFNMKKPGVRSQTRRKAVLVAKASGVISGCYLVNAVFKALDRMVKVRWYVSDGDAVNHGDILAEISGAPNAMLQGERVALNFLQRMSGIATLTRSFVNTLGNRKDRPRIYDTRKTTPLLRAFEKKAVIDGGGSSHRFALYDMAMLKDNHIDAAGGIHEAVLLLEQSGFFKRKPRLSLCIEVRTRDEALEATVNRADIVMLDNMPPALIRDAAAAIKRKARSLGIPMPELEISGGVTLKNLKEYGVLPVQRISVGALTHSAPALDISMLYVRPDDGDAGKPDNKLAKA